MNQETHRQNGQSWWQSLKSSLAEGRRFLREELWDMDLRPLPRIKTALISLLRILSIVIRGFIGDKCYMQAGTLTYLTLMALVPVLALMFSVSKGLGAQDILMQNLGMRRVANAVEFRVLPEVDAETAFEQQFEIIEDSRLAEMPEQFGDLAITVFSLVERTNFRTLGMIGLLFLLWTVVRMMGKVENSFNSIWGVGKPRTLTRKFSDYISILVVVPILVLCATSVNAFLSSERALALMRENVGDLSVVYEFAIRWITFGVVVLAFVFLLMFMPNTKVRLFPALIGGFCTGLAWFAAQKLYFLAQSGVSAYNTIYGTFAALPFFLVWLHTSWLIVLFGAEIAFAVQNHRTYRLEQRAKRATPATLTALGLLVMCGIIRNYSRDRGRSAPWTTENFAEHHEISIRLVGEALRILREKELVLELAEQGDAYVPGRDPAQITVADVEQAFRGEVNRQIDKALAESAPALVRRLQEYRETFIEGLAGNNLRDLLG